MKKFFTEILTSKQERITNDIDFDDEVCYGDFDFDDDLCYDDDEYSKSDRVKHRIKTAGKQF